MYILNENNKKLYLLHLQKQIEYTNKLLGILSDIRNDFFEVCKKYDGKIYTKRFATAVEKLNPLVSVSFNIGMLDLSVADWDNRHYVADIGQGGYICTSYVKEEKITIYLDSKKIGDDKLVLNANIMIQNYDQYLKGKQERLQKLIQDRDNIDKIIREFSEIKSKYENFVDNTDIYIREMFGFKI
jgi:hypothetical protein